MSTKNTTPTISAVPASEVESHRNRKESRYAKIFAGASTLQPGAALNVQGVSISRLYSAIVYGQKHGDVTPPAGCRLSVRHGKDGILVVAVPVKGARKVKPKADRKAARKPKVKAKKAKVARKAKPAKPETATEAK